MANEDPILRTLRDLLIELGHDRDKVEALEPTDDIAKNVSIDSLEVVEYAIAIEERYGTSEITDDEIDENTTLEKLRALVVTKTGRADADPAPVNG